MPGNIFTAVLNMSITASVATVLIIFIRWIFGNRLPKIFNYVLWAIVLVRLLIPFSLPSMFSIFNAIPVPETIMSQSQQYNGASNNIPYSTDYVSIPQENTVSDALNNVNDSFPAVTPEASVDPMKVIIYVISWIWLAGTVGLLSFSIFAYFRASLRLKEAVLYNQKDLIFQCSRKLKLNRNVQVYTSDRVHTPVVCGLIKARIILPLDLTKGCNELELKHIITHELVHIKRFDYILKPLSVLALCVHWFNPVIWISFILSQKDMEMSCDEKVVSVFDNDIRSEYAASLIKLAAKQNVLLNGGLLAFGKSNIKSRIKGIMSFRKPGFWLGAAAIVILVAIGVVLLTNGQHNETDMIYDKLTGDRVSYALISYNKEKSIKVQGKELQELLSKLKIEKPDDTVQSPLGNTIEFYSKDGKVILELWFGEPQMFEDSRQGQIIITGSGTYRVNKEFYDLLDITKYNWQNVQTELYQLSISKEWSAEKQPGSSLIFKKDSNVIGGLDILAYYPDQPISQLQPNHSEIIESRKLEGFFTEVIQERLKITPPAASGETAVTEQMYLFFIMKDKNMAYDLYFNTADVDEQTILSIAKSFKLKSDFDSLMQNPNFLKQGFEIVKMNDPVKIDKETAIKSATAKETIGTYVSEQAKSITAILVKLTDKEHPRLPGSDIVLQDLPVWIVTIHDVNIPGSGGPKKLGGKSDNTFFGDVNVVIDANTGKWVETFSYSNPAKIELENLKSSTILSDEQETALKVVQKYFDSFAKADYKTMSTLATENHNKNLIHDGDVWGMKWAKAKEIKLIDDPKFLGIDNLESTMVFGISVDMETAKTSAQYPSTQTFLYVVLVKGEDGIWRVDNYTTG